MRGALEEARDRLERRENLTSELGRMVGRLREFPAVRKVILFGSFARGSTGIASDLDLVVICETTDRFVERTRLLLEDLAPRVATDILVYTPAEWEEMAHRPFFRRIRREGRVLYERSAPPPHGDPNESRE